MADQSSQRTDDTGTAEAVDAAEAAEVPMIRPDHRCFRCHLVPAAAAVGMSTKVEVTFARDVTTPLPDGAAMPVVGRVDWQGFAPHLHRWLPLPEYAKPFPWDPHSIVPNIDFVGLRVRAIVMLTDPNAEKPVVEYEGDRLEFEGPSETYAAQAAMPRTDSRVRPRRYATDDVVVKLPRELAAAADRIGSPSQHKFGFHAVIGGFGTQRLVVLAFKPTPAAPHDVTIEAVEMPDDDTTAMVTKWRGLVRVSGPDVPPHGVLKRGAVCDLNATDQVTMTIHADTILLSALESLPPTRTPGVAATPATPAVPAGGGGGGLEVVVRTAKDRDLVALCLRTLLQASSAAPSAGGGASPDEAS